RVPCPSRSLIELRWNWAGAGGGGGVVFWCSLPRDLLTPPLSGPLSLDAARDGTGPDGTGRGGGSPSPHRSGVGGVLCCLPNSLSTSSGPSPGWALACAPQDHYQTRRAAKLSPSQTPDRQTPLSPLLTGPGVLDPTSPSRLSQVLAQAPAPPPHPPRALESHLPSSPASPPHPRSSLSQVLAQAPAPPPLSGWALLRLPKFPTSLRALLSLRTFPYLRPPAPVAGFGPLPVDPDRDLGTRGEEDVRGPAAAAPLAPMAAPEVAAPVRDEELHILIRDAEAKSADSNVSSTFPLPPRDSGTIIPIYCSLLAAVVVGLLAYVAFKCWRTHKQKQELAKVRVGELGIAEGEKLHSDSSICLDTTGLHELQALGKGAQPDPGRWRLYGQLPSGRQEEVEQLLVAGSPPRAGWQVLAKQLGYEAEAVETMGQSPAPAHTLLCNWATEGGAGATLEVLETSLRAIGREDVARALWSPEEGNSMV
uniref:Death domain-containing protein n=1 Tax=Sarcophilus harrisii TaxID=9305 RepID=A0A7N4PMY4_SARHA